MRKTLFLTVKKNILHTDNHDDVKKQDFQQIVSFVHCIYNRSKTNLKLSQYVQKKF